MTRSFTKFVFALAAAAAALSAVPLEAKTPAEVRAQCQREHRPCVGLVLSGGGARGFAHVGVLKVLERLRVKVDIITGTSMGSMVGGAYAAGYTAGQLQETIEGVDWKRMFAARTDREELPWRQKRDDYVNLSNSSIVLTKKGEVLLPESLVPSQELNLFLEKETGVVNHINDLSELAIPFAAVATNLVTGRPVELQKGINLSTAMRASMSVPGVFAPVTIGDKMMVDGGLVDNLPVDLARRMGADVVIAVNVGTPLLKREELSSVVMVMGQMVNILTEQNVTRSIASLKDTDILITPDLAAFDSTEMERGSEIIEAGRLAAEAVADRLEKFSVPEVKDYVAWERERQTALLPETRKKEHLVSEVRIEGLTYVNEKTLLNELAIDTSKPVTNEQIEASTRRIWADGNFSNIRYRFEPAQDGSSILVFEPKEKRPGFSSIRIGGSVQTDFQSSQSFNVVFGHTWGWLNDWGGEWHNELQAGEVKRFTSEFLQPLGPTSMWFVQPHVEYLWQPYDVYRHNEAIARFRNEQLEGGLDLGYALGRNGYIKGTVGYMSAKAKREIGELDNARHPIHSPYISLEFAHDTLDNVNFPTRGSYMTAKFQRLFDSSIGITNQTLFHFSGRWPFSAGPWTLMASADWGKAALDNVFSMGGAQQMTGSPYNRWTGSNLQWGSLQLSRNMSDVVDFRGNPVWVGASYEIGRAWNNGEDDWADTNDKSFHHALGAYIGVDSVIGPLYLMTGYTFDVGAGVYFFWGHPM